MMRIVNLYLLFSIKVCYDNLGGEIMRTIEIPDGYKIGPLIEKQDNRLTIVITKSMREKIFNEAKEKDISLSAVVNKALKMYFNEK